MYQIPMSCRGTVLVHFRTVTQRMLDSAKLIMKSHCQGILTFSVPLQTYAKSKCFECIIRMSLSWSEIPRHSSQLSKISCSPSNSVGYKRLETRFVPQPADRAMLLSTDFTRFICWLSCAQPLQSLLMLPAPHSAQEETIWKNIPFHLEARAPPNP